MRLRPFFSLALSRSRSRALALALSRARALSLKVVREQDAENKEWGVRLVGFTGIGPRKRIDLHAKIDDRFRGQTGYGGGADMVDRNDGPEGDRERLRRV